MDFHLRWNYRYGKSEWFYNPPPQSDNSGQLSGINNFREINVEGVQVGAIIGWSDFDVYELWEALHHPDFKRAHSILKAADGTFSCIFCVQEDIYIVTDVSGSIPIFYGFGENDAHVATKAEMVASETGASVCPISIADFIQNGAVCHPFTLFKGIRVAPPASITSHTNQGMSSSYYWTPDEVVCHESLAQKANQLRENVRSVLEKGLGGAKNVTVMFSGGEDARALIGLLPKPARYRLVLIADGKNREYVLAQKAAQAFGLNAELITRNPDHYREMFAEKVGWVGCGNDVRHLHVFDGTKTIMKGADAVIGGLGSDKLFKSDYLGNVSNKAKQSLLPERLTAPQPDRLIGIGGLNDMKWMRPEIAEAVWKRHQLHNEMLKQFRPRTAGNWHTLWPLGGHSQAHSQFLNNIRYGPRVVEPFIASSTYRMAAEMPDEWKIDRKVFSKAFVPVMGRAAWVPVTAGRVPALNGISGRLIQFVIKTSRVVFDEWQKKRYPSAYGAQGPWSSDHKAFDLNPDEHMPEKSQKKLNLVLHEIVDPDSGVDGFWQGKGRRAFERKVLAGQVGQVLATNVT